ncbi:glycoside hydrolase family 57 [Candidatus Vecturithrix granuli]|uniref:Glycoside hydrolase family 57 n=1 Tax=Vecturithrix granuli TaxID=1499967 RepID=A0A081C8V0_VECG1|nr:glycoside hydrolase family 57 [Candidatus Vecturithrix granuli]
MQTIQQDHREKKIYLVLHGHFYQPPRENPWTQAIPSQDSAKPYHDWNDRITAECYKPNTRSRALDEQGRILDLLNNFAFLNFNIGPTLMSWMEKYYPDTYQRILEADRKSLERNHGHGNAIAQVYNHVIMPLANTRDQLTQIIWGKREFAFRFKREPESIWLAETAINQETVRCLIAQDIKYVILSPTQAQRVRKIGETEWKDVSNNGIDTTQPYRLFLHEEHGKPDLDEEPARLKYLDVFFYDGGLSTAISFQHLLRDANSFAHKLYESASKSSATQVLVHVATDGEIYGHHEAYGDMCLSAAFTSRLPVLQVEVTNYGRYLELYPPTLEVELKPGENGEGTAWSCAHGVGRWYRNCGCSASHNPTWNQEWRTPLRKGFDILRDALAAQFEQIGGELLQDPWEARNDYIECLLDPSEQTFSTFLDRHVRRALNQEERITAMQLLEAQKYVLFSYTSCAWFFDDISGLEPIQNMRYAARALQLIEGLHEQHAQTLFQEDLLTAEQIEDSMLAEFKKARSNLLEYGTGKDLYLKFVKPEVYTPERAANHFLLENYINHRHFRERTETNNPALQSIAWNERRKIHIYTLYASESVRWQSQPSEKCIQLPDAAETTVQPSRAVPEIYGGVLHVQENTTQQTWRVLFISFIEHTIQPVSYLKRIEANTAWQRFFTEMARFTSSESNTLTISSSELVPFLESLGCQRYGLADVYYDDRERLFCRMLEDHITSTESHIRRIYEDHLELLNYLTTMNVQVPVKLRASVKFSLSHQLMIEIEKLSVKDITQYSPALLRVELERILYLSKQHQLELEIGVLQDHLSQALTSYLTNLSQRISSFAETDIDEADIAVQEQALQLLQETINLFEKAKELGVVLDKAEIQNLVYDMLERAIPHYLSTFKAALRMVKDAEPPGQRIFFRFFKEYTFLQECLHLAQQLNFNIARYRKFLLSAELSISEHHV